MKNTPHIGLLTISLLLASLVQPESLLSGATADHFRSAAVKRAFSDLHNSALIRLFAQQKLHGLEEGQYPVSMAGLKAVNAQLLFLSVGVPRFSLQHPDTIHIEHVLRFMKAFRSYSKKHYPDLAFTPDHRSLKAASSKKQTGWVFALEGTHLLRGEISWIDSLYEAGVRMVGLAHWFHNHFLMLPGDTVNAGDGYTHVPPSPLTPASVLSPRGKELVRYLLQKNMFLDVSHLPEAAFWEVVELNGGRSPLIASHSNARALCDVPRNLEDAQIRAIAETGGLIGVCLHQPLLQQNAGEAGLPEVADHIRYLVEVAGDDHVAMGTDLEGRISPPAALRRIENMSLLFDYLKERGMADSTIHKIMFENVTRLILGR